MSNQKDYVEAALLYPSMEENPELRWAFIRKVYSILSLQLLATIAVAAVVAQYPSIAVFIWFTWGGRVIYVLIAISLLIVTCLLAIFQSKHPHNFILLGIFVLFFGFILGLASALISGTTILEAVIATAVVVLSLTVYTFWAAKKGQDFGFLIPFLLTLVVTFVLFTIFQIFYPMPRIADMIYSGIGVLIFSAYIIFDTEDLIKRSSYDEYIWAAVVLYLDVLNIFIRLLRIFANANRR